MLEHWSNFKLGWQTSPQNQTFHKSNSSQTGSFIAGALQIIRLYCIVQKPQYPWRSDSARYGDSQRLSSFKVSENQCNDLQSFTKTHVIRQYTWPNNNKHECTIHCCTGASQVAPLFVREMRSQLPSWECDVKQKIRLCQLMHTYVNNNPAKLHPNLIRNNAASGSFEEVALSRTKTRCFHCTVFMFYCM